MTEINKNPEFNIGKPVQKNVKPSAKQDGLNTEGVTPKDYKDAASALGQENYARAMVMMNGAKGVNSADDIERDVQKIIANPGLAYKSDIMFCAAERAGIDYAKAATFATTELG